MLSGMADFILFMAKEYSIVCVCVSHLLYSRNDPAWSSSLEWYYLWKGSWRLSGQGDQRSNHHTMVWIWFIFIWGGVGVKKKREYLTNSFGAIPSFRNNWNLSIQLDSWLFSSSNSNAKVYQKNKDFTPEVWHGSHVTALRRYWRPGDWRLQTQPY